MWSDRTGSSDDMPMMHEFTSSMLGAGRAGVTETLAELAFNVARFNEWRQMTDPAI